MNRKKPRWVYTGKLPFHGLYGDVIYPGEKFLEMLWTANDTIELTRPSGETILCDDVVIEEIERCE